MAATSKTPADNTANGELPLDTTAPESDTTTNDAAIVLSPEQEAVALALADTAIAGEADSDPDDAEADDGVDPFDGIFASAPPVPGEFRVFLSELGEWPNHPRFGSRRQGDHFHALALTAEEPEDLRPIEVLPKVDGVHPIVDGRFTYFALMAAHDGNEDVMVRCVLYPGTEAEAVAAVSDAALGSVEASAMEKAQALRNLQVAGISQRAICERYPRLSKDKASNLLIAARMRAAHPALFTVLHEPDRAPISYGTDILTLSKAMPADAFQAMLDRAEDLAANGDRCKPTEAFDLLQVDAEHLADLPAAKPAKAKPITAVTTEDIFGEDDKPVAAYERLADNIDRIRLPDVSAMSLSEREAAAEACIVQVRRHFGLDQQQG